MSSPTMTSEQMYCWSRPATRRNEVATSATGGGHASVRPDGNPREHLFISYAWEDGAMAEWLALKFGVGLFSSSAQ